MLVSIWRLKSFEIGCISLLIISCILTFTSAPLSASYWLDECISAWVSNGSPARVVDRTLQFQGQSPLYFLLLWFWRSLYFDSEIWARGLSILLFFLATISLYRLAARLFNSQVALLSLIPFLLHDQVLLAAIEARPYMLALTFYIASLDFLISYLQSNHRYYGILSVLCLTLSFYAHYLFIVGALVHAVALQCFGQTRRSRVFFLTTIFFTITLLCSPAIPHLKSLSARSAELSFSPLPGIGDLLLAFMPVSMLVYIVCSMVVPWSFLRCEFLIQEFDRRKLIFVLCWLILGPSLYFLHARFSGHSLFQERYFLWTAPAVALLSGYLMSLYRGPKARLLCLSVFVVFGLSREISREWRLEDWRSAVAELDSDNSSSIPWLYTGLIEAEDLQSMVDPENADYLRAPLLVYGYRGESRLLSSKTDLQPMSDLSAVRLLLANKVLIDSKGQRASVLDILMRKLEALGFSQIQRTDFGELSFVVAGREVVRLPAAP